MKNLPTATKNNVDTLAEYISEKETAKSRRASKKMSSMQRSAARRAKEDRQYS